MKKLMFATALAVSAAAFADGPINAIGFEDSYYTIGFTNFTNGVEERNDVYQNAGDLYFGFDGDSNSSVVTNESPSTTQRTAYFAEANNTKYLALDTEGGTFWRSINNVASGYLGTAQTVTDNIYLDTLVQFTVTEDDAPEVGGDDKLAIWLQAGEGTTNLMVRAAIIDDYANLTPTNFVISNASVVPGIWYRLTVKTIADATENDGVLAFQIYLDGNTTPLKSSLLSFTDEYIDLIDSSYKSAIEEGSVFVSLKGTTSGTLTGVGFMGTGAVDEIVWTTENPIAAPAPEYPDYLDTADNTIKAKYDEWKTTYSADTLSVYENEFLVNANPATTTVTSNALEITEIKENTTDGGWDITIGCSIAGVDLTGTVGSTIVCNGYLAVSYTDNLAGTWTTENIAVTEVDSTTGTVTVNVNKSGAKFMKVSLTVAPQAAPGGAGAGE